MKLQLTAVIFIIILSLLLISCENIVRQESQYISSQNDETSEESINENTSSEAESSEVSEEKKVWTEVEEKGNAKITREYRDGENDYTVTIEEFDKEGALYKLTIETVQNGKRITTETTTYGQNDSYVKETSEYDEHDQIAKIVQEAYSGKYVEITTRIPTDDDIVTEIEYKTPEGNLVAKGTVTTRITDGEIYWIKTLDKYDSSEKISKYELITTPNNLYQSTEILDSDGNIEFSYEANETKTIAFIGGEINIYIVIENEASLYYDENKEFMAELVGANITKISSKYDINIMPEIIINANKAMQEKIDEVNLFA